ncbi:unnamed protein product [Victoria cruziana]
MVVPDMKDSEMSRGDDLFFWGSEQMDYLVQLLLEQARIPGMRSRTGLKKQAYLEIEKKMIEKYGSAFTKKKLKDNFKSAAQSLTICKEILNTSGFSWDPNNKRIIVDLSVWAEYIQKYPDRRKYENEEAWKYNE